MFMEIDGFEIKAVIEPDETGIVFLYVHVDGPSGAPTEAKIQLTPTPAPKPVPVPVYRPARVAPGRDRALVAAGLHGAGMFLGCLFRGAVRGSRNTTLLRWGERQRRRW